MQPSASTTAVCSPPKKVLHVGAGRHAERTLHWSFRGWEHITVDVDPACHPDYIASIVSMWDVPSFSFDAVYASHVLEHVYAHEVPLALVEFLRVLKPDGDLLLRLPDLQQACAAVAEGREEQYLYQSPAGPIAPLDILFGYRAAVARLGEAMSHRTGFTQATLEKTLRQAGFVEAKVWVEGFDLWATAQKEQA